MTQPLTSAEIRQKFLNYFEKQGHTIVTSSSLIPANDPTLLFTNAGMVQFKDSFLGLEKRAYKRATTSQKCMRVAGKHNDLENVGPSPRHHTFFEMLGNFSLGDYFKKDAIRFAYDLLVNEYGIDPERLYYTVHTDDDEAFGIWTKDMGIDPARVYRMGDATNFWQMADVGPCGPTSELHYDWGKDACTCGEPDCSVLLDNGCDRWLEIWNLVFMQFNQDADGNRTPLPAPGVDTGMGLERIVSVLQNKRANYETDLFTPIIKRTQELLGDTDAQAAEKYIAYRVIADHGRAITFMVGDGVMPGNEGREYVLRLILRRAARYGRIAGFTEPFLAKIAETVIEEMGGHYTELVARRQFILNVIQQEEERFLKTFAHGLDLLKELVDSLKAEGKTEIPGSEVFKLHATFGFPFHLTRDIAAEEYNFTVDEAGFRQEMKRHSEISGSGSFKTIDEASLSVYANLLEDLKAAGTVPEHNPYQGTETDTTVLAILQDGQRVDSVGEGLEIELVLAKTPFYAESGGQISDTGSIAGDGWEMTVTDERKPVTGMVVHSGQMTRGTAHTGDAASARVDAKRRMNIMRNHTATHLLQAALQSVLGKHVAQAGSLVAPDRLRFDFSHPAPMTAAEIRAVEAIVNQNVLAGYPVTIDFKNYKDAVSSGAMALFGEKYGDVVRVITVDGNVSRELCGGTHVSNTAHIGAFVVTSEGSVAAGVRRIEAVTGDVALETIQSRLMALNAVAAKLGTKPEAAVERLDAVLEHSHEQEKEIKAPKRQLARADFEQHLQAVQTVNGVPVLAAQVAADDSALLREMGDWFRDKLGSGVIVLGTVLNGKPSLIAIVTDDWVKRGLHAGKLVKAVAQMVGGGGGGRPNMAQAGGKNAAKLPDALAAVPGLVAEMVK